MEIITLESKKIHDLIQQKNDLVKDGRSKSKEIEKLEKEIEKLEEQEKEMTGAVECKEELKEGKKIQDEINALFDKLDKVKETIFNKKMEAIPEEVKKKHEKLLKDKEKQERERGKIALKIQKIKDKVAPMIQKECKPHLTDEYDDISTAVTKGGKVLVTKISHLEEWKAGFAQKKAVIAKDTPKAVKKKAKKKPKKK